MFYEIYSNLSRTFGEKVRNIKKDPFVGGSGPEHHPEVSKPIIHLVNKSNPAIVESFFLKYETFANAF